MHNLLPEYQSAYRKLYICETSLLKLVNDTLWAKEQQQITAVLIMDRSAAFDTVNHDLLLNIIKIQSIRKYLTKEMCHKHILQMVISHLDYTNSLLAGLPYSSIKIMQKIQTQPQD